MLGETGIFVATAFGASVKSIAADLEKLYFASQRTGSGVATLRAYGLGAEAVGVSAETARSSVERLSSLIRSNPGYRGYLSALGVNTKAGGVEVGNQLIDRLNDMINRSHGDRTVATQIASMFGIDEQTFFMLSKFRAENKKTQDQYLSWLNTLGLSKNEINKDSESAHKFMNDLRFLGVQFDTMWTVLEARFLPAADAFVNVVGKIADFMISADKHTGGVSSWVGGILATFGAVGAAKWGLKQVGKGARSRRRSDWRRGRSWRRRVRQGHEAAAGGVVVPFAVAAVRWA